MDLILYRLSGEENFVDKDNSWNISSRTSHLTELITLDGDIRTDCNIQNPRILINSFAPLNFPEVNYAKIPDFNRYYFVRTITAAPEQGHGMYWLDLHVDVLMSFKSDLLHVGGIVERSETYQTVDEKYLPDALLPVRNDPSITLLTPSDQKSPFTARYQDPYSGWLNIALTVASAEAAYLVKPARTIGNISPLEYPDPMILAGGQQQFTYAMDRNNLWKLSHLLNSGSWFDDLLKGVYGVGTEALIRSIVFPFDIPTHDAIGCSSTTGHIWISGKEIRDATDESMSPLAKKVYPSYNQIFDLGSTTITSPHHDFRDREPYTRYMIYLPYIGWYELQAAEILDKTIYFRYVVDIGTGACTGIVHDGSRILLQQSAKIGIEVPLSSTNAQQVRQTELSAEISTAIGLLSAMMSEGATAPLMAGASLANGFQALVNNRLITRGAAPESALSRWTPSKVWLLRTEENFVSVPLWGHEIGHLVMRSIDGLDEEEGHGLTKMWRVHLDSRFSTATTDERAEISQLLSSGVIM